jgi:hypothetical protein
LPNAQGARFILDERIRPEFSSIAVFVAVLLAVPERREHCSGRTSRFVASAAVLGLVFADWLSPG